MWIRSITAIAYFGCAALSASAQQGAAPQSPTQSTSSVMSAEQSNRLLAFVTLLAAACTPELVEQARKGAKACALIWYALSDNQPTIRLPNALAKTGYRPVVRVTFSEDGDPLKTRIRVAHPQTGLVSNHPVTELAGGMTVAYIQRGAETLNYHYTVVGVIFPALCKAYPDKCGMRVYKERVFSLREYREDNFDAIAPGHSDPFAGAIPLQQ
jgi:hypothetical protein